MNIGTFSLRNHMIEIFEWAAASNPPSNTSEILSKFALFPQNYTKLDRIAFLKNDPLEVSLLIVAEASGVYLMDIGSMSAKGPMNQRFYKHHIPIKNASKVMRFHNFLYVLTEEPEADVMMLEPKSQLFEILLFDRGMKNWDNEVNSENQQMIFKANRKLGFDDPVLDFYVDDRYLYVNTGSEHRVYHRGVSAEYKFQELAVEKTLRTESKNQFSKVIANGKEYLLAVGSNLVAEYDISISDHHLKCPNFLNDEEVFGDYELELNVTTRHCPLKENKGYNLTTVSRMVCSFQRKIKVAYSRAFIYESRSGSKRVLAVLLVILLALLSIGCYCFRLKAKLQRDYEAVKKQVGMLPNTAEKDFMALNTHESAGSQSDRQPGPEAEMERAAPPKDEEAVDYEEEG